MKLRRSTLVVLPAVASMAVLGWFALSQPTGRAAQAKGDGAKPFGIDKRVPWTASKVKGSPEAPYPFRAEMAFPHLAFDFPLDLVMAPGTNRWFVAQQFGKIHSFPNDPKCKQADLAIDLAKEVKTAKDEPNSDGVDQLYALVFHPKFQTNRYCYVCYVLKNKTPAKGGLPNGSRISRFTVTDTNPPRLDPASEKIIITWLEGGHNGCCLKFGKDGYLYISTGDGTGPSPPDGLDTGQDVSDLLSCILRIDVDHTDPGKNYAVPKDNPFIKLAGARPEIWAYGLRNPWRMSIDRLTGDLWVADVGWEKWEMIYRIQKGGNYGWSVMEGPQMVRPEAKKGPTPILPPQFSFPHTEAASITGGFVYRGKKFPELYGTYLCGDWETRRVWGTKFDGDKVVSHKVLTQTGQRVVGFGEDADGELFYLDHDPKSGVWHLVRNEEPDHSKDFPRKLSDTGLFADTAKHQVAPGVVPYSVNAPQWQDGAVGERFIALPTTSTAFLHEQPQSQPKTMFQSQYFFPKDGVLVKTNRLEMERGKPASAKRIETQILHYDGNNWNGYTYRWNEQQTDAMLVASTGDSQTFKIKDAKAPGGEREQTWHFFGRAQCLQCHNPWAGYNLAFTPAQLDRDHGYGDITDNQLRTLEHVDILAHGGKVNEKIKLAKKYWQPLVNPYDTALGVTPRARSYLQVNCAHCHQFGAGGAAQIDLRFSIPLAEMKAVDLPPIQGDFGMAGAAIVAPGDPFRSVLFYRISTLGKGRMPHIGSHLVDPVGLQLIHDWIKQMPVHQGENMQLAELISLAKNKQNPPQQDTIIKLLLQNPGGALLVVKAFDDDRLPAALQEKIVKHAQADCPAHIRDLFERFIPDSQKIKRLGDLIDPQVILKLTGKANAGEQLVMATSSMQCLNCHKINGKGTELGPDLSKIGGKLNRNKLLDSLLYPSKEIEPKYVAHTVVLGNGKIYTGLVAEKTAKEIALLDAATKKTIRLSLADVDQIIPQKTSLMPEGLLRDLTAQQAADLLAYLEGLK